MTTMDDWEAYARFRDDIAKVMDQRFHSLAWLDGEVWSGRARIWSTAKSAIVATLKVYPTGARELHGLVAIGGLDDIIGMIAMAEAWGRELGCVVSCIESRPGWAREMKGFGYEPHQLTIRKEL